MADGENQARPTRRRRYRPRTVNLEDGATLSLQEDGTLVHRDRDGATRRTWNTDDPDWASHAIRFGLREPRPTVPPTGRRVPGTRPPPW